MRIIFVLVAALLWAPMASAEIVSHKTQFHTLVLRDTPEEACRDVGVTVIPGLYYDGEYFSGLEPIPNTKYRWFCVDSYGNTAPVVQICSAFDENNNRIASKSFLGPCPTPQCVNCCGPSGGSGYSSGGAAGPRTSAGNPIEIRTGVKHEEALDWVSPKDNRFRIARYYRSNGDQGLGFNRKYVSRAMHGGVWRSLFNDAIKPEVWSSKQVYYRHDGSRIYFDGERPVSSGPGLDLTLTKYGTGDSRRKVVSMANGVVHQFDARYGSGGISVLSEMYFPDGYEITITRNSKRIVTIEDNKGQRAQFTWVMFESGAQNVDVVSRIEIDTDYDGSDFNPQIALDYVYEGSTVAPEYPVLIEVMRTDIVADHSYQIFAYAYATEGLEITGNNLMTFPRLLTSIRDGRLDDQGQPFDYATFEYSPPGTVHRIGSSGGWEYVTYRPATLSTHFGGADQHVFNLNTANLGQVTGPLGRTEAQSYSQEGAQTLTSSVAGLVTPNCLPTTQTYDYTPNAGAPEGFVYARTERNGARTVFERDAKGRILTTTEDADGLAPRVTSYTWHADLHLLLTRTTSQLSEAFTYTPEGLLQSYSQTDVLVGSPDNGKVRTWSYVYTTLASGVAVLTSIDGPGLLADGVNDVTTYAYDEKGNLTSITDPNGHQTQFLSHNAAGQPTLLRNSDTTERGFSYDVMGRVTEAVFDPNGASPKSATYVYDVVGQLTSYTSFRGKTWSFKYNEARRLVQAISPTGDVASYQHDAMGNVTKVTYSDGIAAATFWQDAEFDELGRLLKTLGAEGQVWQFSHDVEDNLETTMDPLALQTTNSFDALNRLVKTVDRAGYSTLTDHDEADRVTEYTDPRQIDTGFTYNGFGDLIREASADRGTISMTYSNRGLVASMTDGRGVVSNYSYDDGGRLTARRFPSDPQQDQTFIYDLPYNSGQGYDKIGEVRGSAGATEYRYKHNGFLERLRQGIGSFSYDVKLAFNREGMITKVTTPARLEIKFNYNSDGKLSQITAQRRVIDPVTNQYPPKVTIAGNFHYLPNGPMTSVSLLDGSTHTATYDNSYRLTRLTDTLGTTTLRDVSYGWSARDNLELVTDHLNPAKSESYGYTPRGFLNSADGPWDELDFTYDAVGNRLSRTATVGGVTATDSYSYPAISNRLAAIAGPTARTFTHDAAGNVTYDDRTGVGYGYDYDTAGRMESFSINGVIQAEYGYNPQGQQVLRRLTQTGQTFHVIFDADGNRLAEYEVDELEGTHTLLREYIWMGDVPIAVVENDQFYLIRTDHIGRPVFATDVSGAKVWEATYLPFGGVHASTGDPIKLRFPGQWFQSESGLHQNWMRDYDPTTGRYMQADPLGLVDGASVYGYARQNPGRYVDPRGEDTIVVISTPKSLGFGHASIILPDMIYDPNGSCWCEYDDNGFGPHSPGSGDVYYDPTDKTITEWWNFQRDPEYNLYAHRFSTSHAQESAIRARIEGQGGGGIVGCAISVSSALTGIGPFRDLKATWWPTRLNSALHEIGQGQ